MPRRAQHAAVIMVLSLCVGTATLVAGLVLLDISPFSELRGGVTRAACVSSSALVVLALLGTGFVAHRPLRA